MTLRTHRTRQLIIDLLTLALSAAALGALAAPVRADVTACLEDGDGNRLRRVWVQHWFTDYMSNSNGCVTIDADGPIDIRVFAHNPVVRMDDGRNFGFEVSQEIRGVRDGQTREVPAQGAFWRVAEHFRDAYNDGLREFAPWNDASFPAGNFREPTLDEYRANEGVIRAVWPDGGPAVRAWVEGAAIATGFAFAYVGFPLVHLKDDDENDHETIAHELGHALHFSKISNIVRIALEASYGLYLATHAYNAHCFDLRTDPVVAWIEAFGFFAAEYEDTATGDEGRHEAFFDRVAGYRGRLLDGDDECDGSPQDGEPVKLGDDVEGAVFLALFHDFARHPDVGLDLVVESYVTCESMDVQGYADCIADRFGAGSAVHQALLAAAGCYGIELDGAPPPIAGVAEASDRFGEALARGDFNGDEIDDLAIGSPGEAIGSIAEAGMVSVLYGMPDGAGLTTLCNAAFSQNSAGIPGGAETDDHFGEVLAAGDFDADGFSDLAIAAPSEGVAGQLTAGYVIVLPGSPHGLDWKAATDWWENKVGVAGVSGPGDHLGRSLVAGDFDRDGDDDLAIGEPGEDNVFFDTGAVLVLYGNPGSATVPPGLQAAGSQLLTQPESAEQSDYFGSSLGAGDFDGDGRADLAVGANGESVGTILSAGAVSLFYGQPGGLAASASRHWTQDTADIAGVAARNDNFGTKLAFGDFDANGIGDLAIGVPREAVGSATDAGAVAVLYGSTSRTASPRNELWTQDSGDVVDLAETGDRFGTSVAAADFDGDGHDDLAAGVPAEDVGSVADAGAVGVLYGAPAHRESRTAFVAGQPLTLSVFVPAGLDDAGSQLWSQTSGGIADSAEAADAFGTSVVAGDFDADGEADLAIGAALENVGSVADAGALNVIRGASAGLTNAGDQLWHQDR